MDDTNSNQENNFNVVQGRIYGKGAEANMD